MPPDGLAILFYLAYEVIIGLLIIVGLVVSSVGITAALIIVLYALARRVFSLRRGSRLRDDREKQGFVLEWLR
ncbi:hypothetical protein ACSDR0_30510 [Streptosporangium sp. G11]|uniref:hypothetical protein n=1 Tax=Streptosporangium sp. G11 TaxID=3436926 RepID=UPI003EB71289